MAVTPAPVWITTQWPLVLSFTSVVGLARSFHLALVVRVIRVVVGLARSFHLSLVVRVIHVVVGLARS